MDDTKLRGDIQVQEENKTMIHMQFFFSNFLDMTYLFIFLSQCPWRTTHTNSTV